MYTELIKVLTKHSKTVSDIVWVGEENAQIPVDHFLSLLKNGEADHEDILNGMLIVGFDWWIEVCGNDGGNWFEFRKLPVIKTHRTVKPDTVYQYTKNDDEGNIFVFQRLSDVIE